jgi:hypothetical protein
MGRVVRIGNKGIAEESVLESLLVYGVYLALESISETHQ